MNIKSTSVLLGVGLTLASFSAKAKQPNILFICIDDLRNQLGAYGNEFMITPTLDKLASESRLFSNHYVQVPTSGSSRACLLTGMPMPSTKSINHSYLAYKLQGKNEAETPETFIHHLRRNGYYTVGLGKVSHNPDGLHSYQKKPMPELPHSWDKFIHDPTNGKWSNLLHSYADGAVRVRGKENPATQFLERSDEDYPDGVVAKVAIEEMEKLAQTDKPFFLAVGFHKPHLPFCAPKKYWDMYQDANIEIAPNPNRAKDISTVFLHNSTEFFNQYTHPETGSMNKLLSDDYAKDIRRSYYAALTYTDTQVGKVLAKLKELGLDKNTIIVVWGDHGWNLGDNTIWGKHCVFDKALESTLIVKTPNMKIQGTASESLVASIDIYPTICELADVKIPEGLAGKSFVPIINNPKAKTRDHVMSYWRDILSLRTEDYRFSVHMKNGVKNVMLFDHNQDPNETINVAKQNPEIVEQLTKLMRENNNGYLPEL